MTTTTRNEAAERLLLAAVSPNDDSESIVNRVNLLDEALAAERRATVERIRERLAVEPRVNLSRYFAILDEEAQR